MTAEKKRRVTISIIAYQSNATLERCLAALENQSFTDFRVLLFDNDPETGPPEAMLNRSFDLSYKPQERNLGFAGGMSEALLLTDTEFLAALNPDAFPDPDWLAALVAAAEAYPEIAAFGSLQKSATDPERVDGFGDGYLFSGQAWRGTERPAGREIMESFGVCAAAALYRTETLRDTGGFDPALFCFYEDVDVAFRLRLSGHRLAIVPTAAVQHVGGASFKDRSDLADRLIARNQWRVLIKNMPLVLLLPALPVYLAFQLKTLLFRIGSARFEGMIEGWRGTADALQARRAIQKERTVSAFEIARTLSWNPIAFFRRASPVTALRGQSIRD